MSKISNLKALLLAGAVVATCMPVSAADQEFSLSYFMGPKHRFNAAFFTPFAENLAKISGGQLTVKQYPGGALNSAPPMQYSTLIDGVADIAFGIASYTYELFPLSSAISVPGICHGSVDCTKALWSARELIEKEYNAKVLAMWSNQPMAIVTKDKPIKTLEDFKGLKIRVSSKIEARFMAALGAAPVSQPVTVINQNLANGTIDAIAIDPTSVIGFKLYEPANYVTLGIPTSGLPFWLLMNKDVFNGLTDQQKAWVEEASGQALSIAGAQKTAAMGPAALEAIKKNGVEIVKFSDQEVAKIGAAFNAEVERYKTEKFKGVSGADIISAMQGK